SRPVTLRFKECGKEKSRLARHAWPAPRRMIERTTIRATVTLSDTLKDSMRWRTMREQRLNDCAAAVAFSRPTTIPPRWYASRARPQKTTTSHHCPENSPPKQFARPHAGAASSTFAKTRGTSVSNLVGSLRRCVCVLGRVRPAANGGEHVGRSAAAFEAISG